MFCACHSFEVRYSKQREMSFDVHIVNIAFIAFCLLAVTKLARWLMSSKLSCGSLVDSLLQLSFVLALF